ncbi:heat-shock protein Hsp90 [Prosthecomicrobium hirschii]|uniref:Chaperone protein HtpG n=1 Tax=Prosthecodimorpha hirschii TaxID=665126 RepID=A0A0P6WG21_9HYPH|nr:molecular chaperone HtpG [Prosthecomicrobium hirschii]KPL53602.1 heat-shock protein Hsp90 [Prosthecomicrobium hirschii]
MSTDTIEQPAESHAFQAEVARLLHLMVHSVYSNRDIFLRELISNAADACEKLRWLAVSDPALNADGAPLEIVIEADPDGRRLTVSDNGVGMTRQELVDNLGTIARSGTRAFLEQANAAKDGAAGQDGASKDGGSKDGSRLIGQFGVGFYSAFMVAARVVVTSRRAGSDEAWRWTSDGQGTFDVAPAELADAPVRGTRIVLELTEDAKDYADEATVERVVKTYSAHVPVPIRFAKAGEAASRELTDGSALWAKAKSEVTKEEYAEFYGNVSGQWDEPALTIHYRAEGRTEYSVLLFVPSMKPFDLFDPARKGRVKLYVRRIFISDEVEILPAWARFVRGVIDSEDLPLNLSRELLQSNPLLETIRKGVTGRILSELGKLATSDTEAYLRIWEAFGPVIKEGLYEDPDRRDELFKIIRFKSTKSGDGWRSLADYVADLRENQTRIHYVLADSPERAAASPHLEGFRARDVEVLLLTDPVDAFWVRTALGYDGKPFQSVTQGAADLDAIPLAEGAPKPDAAAAGAAEVAAVVAFVKETLGDRVADVRASTRLAESPACLVAPDFGPDKEFEKLMSRSQGRSDFTKPILELNPQHPLVAAMARHLADADRTLVEDAGFLLFGQARILDGEAPDDPADFGRRLVQVMQKLMV